MTAPKDGGSAFPVSRVRLGGNVELASATDSGMTLRDYFAAKAMAAILAAAGANDDASTGLADAASESDRTIPQQIAFNAYELADAMLAERESGQ